MQYLLTVNTKLQFFLHESLFIIFLFLLLVCSTRKTKSRARRTTDEPILVKLSPHFAPDFVMRSPNVALNDRVSTIHEVIYCYSSRG